MGVKQVPIYRLPIQPKQRVGYVAIKKDRNGKVYIGGIRVDSEQNSGEFRILSMKDGKSYIVLAEEIDRA